MQKRELYVTSVSLCHGRMPHHSHMHICEPCVPPTFMPLAYTSCLFGIPVLVAFALQRPVYHAMFLCVTILSILRWSLPTPSPLLRITDKVVAHLALLLTLFDIPRLLSPWLIFFPLSVIVLWILELSTSSLRLHILLHCVASLGATLFILFTPPSM